jgi:hypothetical protein
MVSPGRSSAAATGNVVAITPSLSTAPIEMGSSVAAAGNVVAALDVEDGPERTERLLSTGIFRSESRPAISND